ncbi:Wadjet anti-phage system protein JetD domain-containing protein [Paenibacillus sp. FSL R5-0490]|uniref:Wadjet anti-phage system protein JetD domain-containing protein n=1 Tax=Paenibacillus sp. FSL R5-0490 TaxID=1920424 RepID=UPI0030D12571
MNIKQTIKEKLSLFKKVTITLEELEMLFGSIESNPSEFVELVLELEQDGVLEPVKSAGRTMKQKSLAYRYRVNRPAIVKQHNQHLQQYRLKIHSTILLDSYFGMSEQQFNEDRPWIDRIDYFLKTKGFPLSTVPAPERSYQLTGNEKWITDLGGAALLKRLGVWDLLRIHPVSDPLMLAVNPYQTTESLFLRCTHLIVENKTTFQALLPVLPSSSFNTLIYGCGNKITGNLDMFSLQYPITNREHRFFYFGDLDYEGIRIWHEANKQQMMIPALPFYEACLEQPYVLGKNNQRRVDHAVEEFSSFFSQRQQSQIKNCLHSGGYYPQETLSSQQLQHIWRSEAWNQWIDLN